MRKKNIYIYINLAARRQKRNLQTDLDVEGITLLQQILNTCRVRGGIDSNILSELSTVTCSLHKVHKYLVPQSVGNFLVIRCLLPYFTLPEQDDRRMVLSQYGLNGKGVQKISFYTYIKGVTGGKDQTSGGCSLC